MADKLKQGISVLTTFTDGEQPTGAKLNSITAQLRAATDNLEDAVGDIHGGSWPYHIDTTITLSDASRERTSVSILTSAANRKLDIANLGRLVGPASAMNPRTIGSSEVEEDTPVGVHQFNLRYTPDDRSAVVFTDPGFVTYISSPTAVNAAGDYAVSTKGKVVCVTLSTGGTATYITDPRTYGGGANTQGARFNVMPDPNQTSAAGAGLTFSAEDAQGRRTVTLPLITHQQSNIEGTSTTLDGDDINENHQLRLPRVIDGVLTAGDIIPAGFVLLKNETTGVVYEQAQYTYNNGTSFLIGEIDLTAAITAGNQFSALTVGDSITTAIDDLRVKMFTHTHDREFGEGLIHINSITGFLEKPSASGIWIPSTIDGNFAPQYLHRDGWRVGIEVGLNDENAMRGDIMMGGLVSPGDSGISASNDSHKICFGNPDRAMYAEGTRLRIDTPVGADGRDLILGRAGSASGNGGRLRLERGVIGEDGFNDSVFSATGASVLRSRACKPLFIEGFIADASSSLVFDLTEYGLALTDTLFSYTFLIQDSGGTFFHEPYDGSGTTDYAITMVNDGGNIYLFYNPTGTSLTGLRRIRFTVWYYN